MAWTLDSSGTQTCVVGTEETLSSPTTNGTYVFQWRLNNMAAGDVFELRVYAMTLVSGVLEQIWKGSYGPVVPVNPVVQSPPIASDQQLRFTVKQTAGTGRAVDWKALRI